MKEWDVKNEFPIGSIVRIKGYISRSFSAPIGTKATVVDYKNSNWSKNWGIIVKWFPGDHNQEDGDYDAYDFEICGPDNIIEIEPPVKLCPRCGNETKKIKTQGLLVSTTQEETDKCSKCGWC